MGDDRDPEDVAAAGPAPDGGFDGEPDAGDFADPPAPGPHRPAVRPGWRRRTASGALLTGMALGFQQVFEEKREEPSIMMEASGTPPTDLPVEGTLDGLSPRRSIVKIRPWLLDRSTGATTEGAGTPAERPSEE